MQRPWEGDSHVTVIYRVAIQVRLARVCLITVQCKLRGMSLEVRLTVYVTIFMV